jgi:hypothetical protein
MKRFLVQDTDSQRTGGDGHVIQAQSMKEAKAIHWEYYGVRILNVIQLQAHEFAGIKGMKFND